MKEIKVSFRAGLGQPIREVDMYRFLTTSHYDKQLEEIRNTEDKEQRQELKKKLGAITPSGLFRGSMKEKNLVSHTARLCVDIDGGDNLYTAESMKDVLCSISTVEFASYSASGDGVYAIIVIDPEKHRESFDYIQNWFKKDLGITIDLQCHNISRLRFASSDKDFYYNDNAEVLDIGDWKKPEPEMPASEAVAFETSLPMDDFLQYCKRYDGEFQEGNRNHFLFHKACKAREKFELTQEQTEGILRRYVIMGFPESELRTTVRSAYK